MKGLGITEGGLVEWMEDLEAEVEAQRHGWEVREVQGECLEARRAVLEVQGID